MSPKTFIYGILFIVCFAMFISGVLMLIGII